MFTYQIILLVLSILGIVFGIYQYRNNSFNSAVLCLWVFAGVAIIVVALFPGITTPIARLFGFGRGLDIIYVLSILFLFYIVFKLYNKMEEQKKRINELVSQLALKEFDE